MVVTRWASACVLVLRSACVLVLMGDKLERRVRPCVLVRVFFYRGGQVHVLIGTKFMRRVSPCVFPLKSASDKMQCSQAGRI